MRWDMYTSAEKMQVLWVCIGLPVLLLAAWLVRDWMDAGGSKKARKAAKALGSKTDEMEHAISIQAQAVAYRVTQAGIQACLYYRLLVKGQAAMELCALLVVSGMAGGCYTCADVPQSKGRRGASAETGFPYRKADVLCGADRIGRRNDGSNAKLVGGALMSWDMYDMTQKVQVVVVAIVLPLVILAASLWHDWVEEGQSPRARKIMKDWEWNIDEMAHAVNVKGRLIGYRVLQAGVIIYLGYSRLFRDYRSIELSVLAIVSIVAEVLFIIIKTIRNMAGDEDKTQMWKQMGHSVFNNLMYLCIVVDVFWM